MVDRQKIAELQTHITSQHYVSKKLTESERAEDQARLDAQFHHDLMDAVGLAGKMPFPDGLKLDWANGGDMAHKLLEMIVGLSMLMASSKPASTNPTPLPKPEADD